MAEIMLGKGEYDYSSFEPLKEKEATWMVNGKEIQSRKKYIVER